MSYPGFAHGWFGYPELVYEEDGLFETATAVVLFVCIVLLVGAVRRDAWRADRRLAAAMLAIAFAFLLLMLEELSWGQRIVGWETPEDIGELNAQDETNLQNMFVGYNQLIRLAIALVIATMLIGRAAWVRWFAPTGLAPLVPPGAAVYFVPFVIYAHVYGELFEEVMTLFLFAWAFDLSRRLRRGG